MTIKIFSRMHFNNSEFETLIILPEMSEKRAIECFLQ